MFKRIGFLAIIFVVLIANVAMAQDIRVKVNGIYLRPDVPPVVQNGRTMVPFRVIFEAVGAQVNWEPTTKTVTGIKSDSTIILKIGESTAEVNGVRKALDCSPVVINGRTMVPVRFIAENLGLPVDWDEASRLVSIGLDRLYATDGSLIYEGQLRSGKLCGQGTLYKNSAVLYRGAFINGAMNGQGELYSEGKLVYKGEFRGNQITGNGNYYDVKTGELVKE